MTYDPIDLNRTEYSGTITEQMLNDFVLAGMPKYRQERPPVYAPKRTVDRLREVWPSYALANMRKYGWRWDGRLYMRKRHNKIGRARSSTKFLDSIITV